MSNILPNQIKPPICTHKVTCVLFTIILLVSTSVLAQRPDIRSVSKSNGYVTEVVTIKGENFGTNAADLAVFFGAAKGTIESVSSQVIEVKVPPGATFNNISVVNKTNGLIGYAKDRFLLSFGGSHPFLGSMLAPQVNFDAGNDVFDLCMCDFDGDNRVDVAATNQGATAFNVYTNTSSGPGNVGFGTTTVNPVARSLHAACGDLDGDGKPDLVVSESGDGDRLAVSRNTSAGAGSFSFSTQLIKLTGRKTKRIKIADLDMDGKPELIVTDQGTNVLSVLINQSTPGNISFVAAPLNFIVTGAVTTDGLDVADLNGDGIPEIVTSQFQVDNSGLFIIENKSVPGTVNLGPITPLAITKTVIEIRLGDMDGDGKADIVTNRYLLGEIAIFRNQSTAASISFASPVTFVVDGRNYGLDLGDLDGDGNADIVTASRTTPSVTILNNQSTPGSLAFQPQVVATDYTNWHVNIGDVDTDGKPDIVFISNSGTVFKLSVLRNTNCLVPKVTPEGPLSVCTGFPLKLSTNAGRGVIYEWTRDGAPVATGPDAFLDVNTGSGDYQVKATAESGACEEVSNVVDIEVGVNPVSGSATASNTGPSCVGASLQLEVTGVSGATEYRWSGPAGYTATGATPTIANFQNENIGRYTVEVIAGTCVAQEASTVVEVIDIGSFNVSVPGSKVICQGDTKTLTVGPNLPGTTFKWYEGATELSGETNTTLTVSATGEYYAAATYPGCGTTETNHITITVAALPDAKFVAPDNACAGQLIQFTNQSTFDAAATPVYTWTFGDGNTSAEKDPKHSYSSANTYAAKLRVTYEGGACPDESPEKDISIQAATVPAITNPDGSYQVCQGDSLKLEVLGSYNSYLWNTGATTSYIYAKQGGNITVEVTTNTCTLNANRDITPLSAPAVTIQAEPQQIAEGASAQLTAAGLSSYTWSPAATLSDPSVANPVASPLETTTYTVTGNGTNGCRGEASIQVIVKGDVIVTKLSPKSFFSPNEDATNSEWVVGNILDFPQCSVSIYDDKGIKVYEAKPYLNDWNGTYNGKKLPQGVYFYIIKCDGEENTPKAGSITILR